MRPCGFLPIWPPPLPADMHPPAVEPGGGERWGGGGLPGYQAQTRRKSMKTETVENLDTRGAELFTASQLARFCQVDLKTIHNWADKGEVRHFRTPGRHLRFRRADVIEFLRKYGYPVPDSLRSG